MKNKRLEEKALTMITEYYNEKNFQPLFDMLAEDVLWLGPRAEQVVQGKDVIVQAYGGMPDDTTYKIGTVKIYDLQTDRHSWEIVMEYEVESHFTTREVHVHHQRCQISFSEHRIRTEHGYEYQDLAHVIHTINTASMYKMGVGTDNVAESAKDAIRIYKAAEINAGKIFAEGMNGKNYYIAPSDVIYIESMDAGRHSIIHTKNESIKSGRNLVYFTDKYPESFLRSHSCYVINPLYVTDVVRFKVTLVNSITLPIPEKKYTTFKKNLKTFIDEYTRRNQNNE